MKTEQTLAATHQYRLHPEARQAILAKADSAKLWVEIEAKRVAFSARNFGCIFGQDIQSKPIK